jgi:PIN domain nuclease of toxin-antitoxin system
VWATEIAGLIGDTDPLDRMRTTACEHALESSLIASADRLVEAYAVTCRGR